MKQDRVADHNRRMWDRLAKAGIPYTRAQGRLPRTAVGLRKFLDPLGRLRAVRLAGARVLALASGGGWDAVVFAKLRAETTLFDISRRQLETVRKLARKERVRVRFVQGNMKDLSIFPPACFDVVWHSHSLVFVDNAARVLKEVGRVLAPGGVYRMSTMHPTTLRLYGTFDGRGWRPLLPYFENRSIPWRDPNAGFWEFGGKRVFAPTLEYGHRIETIVNNIVAAGMVVDGLWEYSPKARNRTAKPGSDEHLESLFPAFLEVRARKA
jgi:SAM-dependent methyltransferase